MRLDISLYFGTSQRKGGESLTGSMGMITPELTIKPTGKDMDYNDFGHLLFSILFVGCLAILPVGFWHMYRESIKSDKKMREMYGDDFPGTDY